MPEDERYPTEANPDRPEVEVRVAGEALEPDAQNDVVAVDVAEEVGQHARMELLVQNWDTDTNRVRHSDGDTFSPGAEIAVSLGYHAELTEVFAGVITGLTASFGADRNPTLRVSARSKSALLDDAPRSRVLEQSTDLDLANLIAADYGLSVDGEGAVTHEQLVVDRDTDWAVLRRRADALGHVLYVRGDNLVMRPPAGKGDEIVLRHGVNVTELNLTMDLAKIGNPVVVAGWDPETLEPLESEQLAASTEVAPAGDSHDETLGEADWPLREYRVTSPAPMAADELDRAAIGRVTRHALRHIHGQGHTIGLPQLRIDGWLLLQGVGERMAGPHYITAARHHMSERGYQTEFTVGRPPKLRPQPDGRSRGRGLALGVVTDLDDPKGWGRVKVAFPWRTGDTDGVWARLSVLDAGPEHGTWFVPDVGQEVIVAQLDDDERFPVVLGAVWNGVQTPPEEIDAEKNGIRAIVSRSGHRLTFDDTEAALIRVTTAGGREFELSDGEEQITMREPTSGNEVVLASDGVRLTAATGDIVLDAAAGGVKVSATTLEVSTTGPSKVESTATLDLTASATLGLQGALVKIN